MESESFSFLNETPKYVLSNNWHIGLIDGNIIRAICLYLA